jgi:tetratricopeptide (TPR) repeat protein
MRSADANSFLSLAKPGKQQIPRSARDDSFSYFAFRKTGRCRGLIGRWLLVAGLAMSVFPVWAQAPGAAEPPAAAEGGISEFKEWDPLKANKDMEVGTYYLKKGNYDAAIDRFEEAARLQPGLARPYLKLGETYEKKKEWPMAVASYRKYLELFRAAPDAKKVQKRIAELERRIAREAEAEAKSLNTEDTEKH